MNGGNVPDVSTHFYLFVEFWPTRESFGMAQGPRFWALGVDAGPRGGAFEVALDPQNNKKRIFVLVPKWASTVSSIEQPKVPGSQAFPGTGCVLIPSAPGSRHTYYMLLNNVSGTEIGLPGQAPTPLSSSWRPRLMHVSGAFPVPS